MNCFPQRNTVEHDAMLNACTYMTTGPAFHKQYWKRCYDCWPGNEPHHIKGACLNCIAVCHEGHTVDVKPRYGGFYCDCGGIDTHICKLNLNFQPTNSEAGLPQRIPHPLPTPSVNIPGSSDFPGAPHSHY